ncbi:MAG: hypothetical protein E7213_07920 [Clostridium sp.]|nr:hypothetical protein [Clostridium sp.]
MILFNLLKLGAGENKADTNEETEVINVLFDYRENLNYKKILTGTYKDNLIIAAHGEGSHLNLNNTVICGTVDKVENNSDNEVIEDGCSENNCRKLSEEIIDVVKADTITSGKVYLCTCNGFSVSSELFNTKSSLIDGLMNGYTKTILTSIRTQQYNLYMIEILQELIKEKVDINNICWLFNDIEYLKNNNLPFISVNSTGGSLNNREVFKLDTLYKLTGKRMYVFYNNFEVKNKVFGYKYDGLNKVVVYIGVKAIVIFSQNNLEGNIKIYDGTNDIDKVKKIANLNFDKLDYMERILRGLSMILAKNKPQVEEIKSIKKYIEDIKINLLSIFNYLNEVYLSHIYELSIMDKYKSYMNIKMSNLQKMIVKLFIDIDISKYIERLLLREHYNTRVNFSDNYKCSRCKSDLEAYVIKSAKDELFNNRMLYCPICGVNLISKLDYYVDFSINVLEKSLDFTVDVKKDNKHIDQDAYVILNIDDKSIGKRYERVLKIFNIKDVIKIKVDRNKKLGKDFNSYKMVILTDMDLIYLHGIFSNNY